MLTLCPFSIDTGIDYNHPALGSGIGTDKKVVGGYDFVGDAFDGEPYERAFFTLSHSNTKAPTPLTPTLIPWTSATATGHMLRASLARTPVTSSISLVSHTRPHLARTACLGAQDLSLTIVCTFFPFPIVTLINFFQSSSTRSFAQMPTGRTSSHSPSGAQTDGRPQRPPPSPRASPRPDALSPSPRATTARSGRGTRAARGMRSTPSASRA